ncbi:N-acetylmuramoyl-L-alanine amidase, partial [Holdemanella porci]|uniref:N-acetylmuramoyl-L-alanine amidase n=1 Tax=Holdemanella porci TaxID=2652276 RepID=UPI004025034B
TTLHYTYNGEKYYLNFSDLGMDVKFGVDQEYSGYDETLPDMTQDVVEDDELNNTVIQVTNLDDASEEVAEGFVASDPDAAIGLISEDESATQRSNEGVIICLDPGHGGNDSGAIGINNVYEKNLTLKIAQYCKQELEKYNCKVVMTRTGDTNPSLEERADYAKAQGAKYLISIHLNSAASGGAVGAEVYYPNTHWRPDISANGKNVAQAIQSQLVSLGLYDRGIKFRTIDTNIYPDPFRYDDGSVADYYGIIRNAKYNGLTGLIIEHCFINSVSDYNNYLNSDAKLQKLGVADANGIVSALGLTKKQSIVNSVLYRTHVQDIGWQDWKKNGELSGTQAQSKRLEGINIKLSSDLSGNVEYMTHIQDIGWQDWKKNGELSGTEGKSKRLEAIKMKLTGDVASKYDIYYRVHVQDYGWLGWAKNGESSGSEGLSKRLEGIEIRLVKKGQETPGSTDLPFLSEMVSYQTHVQDIGWQDWKKNGELSGTQGESKRLEGLRINLFSSLFGYVEYKAHVQNDGWQGWVSDGEIAGTTGQSKRLEAVRLRLKGDVANKYDIYYRVHIQDYGWLDWAKNGESAGSEGCSKRLEGIEIRLVKKGEAAPGQTQRPFISKSVTYQSYIQGDGWQEWKRDGELSGTQGQSKQLEALKIELSSIIDGGIVYKAHVQNDGWQLFVGDGVQSGTIGQNKRLEAIQIQLTGNAMLQYDIYYRVHVQNLGWLGWAKNGERAGTEGYKYRVEGVEILLVDKDSNAPGNTANHYYHFGYLPDDESELMPIMGSTQTSVEQMVNYYNSKTSGYDKFKAKYNGKYDGVLAKGGARTINEFAQIVYDESIAEGVKPEVVFAQCMKETGYLKYGGDVLPNQYNYAGVGATGAVHGASFNNVRMGIRAQIQHLKAYGSIYPLTNQCVDPRFDLVKRGSAQYVEWLGKNENPNGYGWATAKQYGYDIVEMVKVLLTK